MRFQSTLLFVACLCISISLAAVQSRGATMTVNCDKGDTIKGALSKVSPTGPNQINVSGTCTEDVLIQNMDRLTLMASPSATINAPSVDTTDAIDIVGSRSVTIQGFTINGGNSGVFCGEQSTCLLINNTIQGGAFTGVSVYQAASLTSQGDTIQNNFIGVLAQFGAFFQGEHSTVQSNSTDGVEALLNSSLRLIGNTIVSNAGNGVRVEQNSSARMGLIAGTPANLIQKNSGNGVSVGDLSFVRFTPENKIRGNLTQPDVSCNPQYSATRGALANIGGGTTNCVEP